MILAFVEDTIGGWYLQMRDLRNRDPGPAASSVVALFSGLAVLGITGVIQAAVSLTLREFNIAVPMAALTFAFCYFKSCGVARRCGASWENRSVDLQVQMKAKSWLFVILSLVVLGASVALSGPEAFESGGG